MERINQLLHHPKFTETLKHLEALEQGRIYCRHGLSHLLDVARIASLIQHQKKPMENHIDTELIYAAALLHDLGRVSQYEQGLPHETAGLPLAKELLSDCGFSKEEQSVVLDAVLFHRSTEEIDTCSKTADLRALLIAADKLSRNCFCCAASDTCYWPEKEKNRGIVF